MVCYFVSVYIIAGRRSHPSGPREKREKYSWNIQSVCQKKISICLIRGLMQSLGNDDVSVVHPQVVRITCYPGGVGHGPRDQFCPITSLQMADWFFHLCARSVCDFLRFSPFIKWFTIIFFGKVWEDRWSKLQFLKQYDVCLFSIDIGRCNSSCA